MPYEAHKSHLIKTKGFVTMKVGETHLLTEFWVIFKIWTRLYISKIIIFFSTKLMGVGPQPSGAMRETSGEGMRPWVGAIKKFHEYVK